MARESKVKASDLEFHPDAWERFERATGVVAKSPPQHRVTKKTAKKTKPARMKKRNSS